MNAVEKRLMALERTVSPDRVDISVRGLSQASIDTVVDRIAKEKTIGTVIVWGSPRDDLPDATVRIHRPVDTGKGVALWGTGGMKYDWRELAGD
ncbi:hypothetical protein [Hwanghaeella sp.]|uniref:hypothetical protein n=1 Tax=Hwanghaeella sp. TaxID=2605943 RepID=UPI003CCBBA6F